MVNCIADNCTKSASWALKYYTPIYCKEHGEINNAKPQHLICRCGLARPIFGYKTDKKPSYCKKCKTDTMCDLANKICIESDCNVQARYNYITCTKPEYCNSHKKTNMEIIYKIKPCKKCNKKPLYGYDGKKEYCSEHKSDDMSENGHIKCFHENCNVRASFGYNSNKEQYCKKHMKDGMKKLFKKTCLEPGCNIEPSFGYKDDTYIYCNAHKKENMISRITYKCKQQDCNKRASFGTEFNKPLYCNDHRNNDMFYVYRKKCTFDDCPNIGKYKDKDNSNLFCKVHKSDKMLYANIKRCENPECNKIASFGYPNDKKQYCAAHQKDNMINIAAKTLMCPECPLKQRSNSKYDNYCTECFGRKFPKDPRCKMIRKKSDEFIVRDYINSTFPELNFIHDAPIWTHNCDCIHRRRIDLRTHTGNTILAIEIDERQHKYNNESDENIRYDDVYMIYSGKWIFIRYNPHGYKNDRGLKLNPDREKRLLVLKKEIDRHISRIINDENTELVEIHKLFFDGFKQ
jgi:hypothetical protein